MNNQLRSPSITKIALCAATALWISTPVHAQNITMVNGKAVPKANADLMLKQLVDTGQVITPQIEQQAKDAAVTREILIQEAERRGLQSSAEYLQNLEFQRQTLLINALFKNEQKTSPITDAEMKAQYEAAKTQQGNKEYRARHILVDNEALAKSLTAKIKAGAKFDDLAKKNSKDSGSATHGGDLDWAAASSYVPEFSAAMINLKKGQVTDVPVHSQFGWHIIKLDDVRDLKFPSYEEVKPQIEQRMKQDKHAKFIDDLRSKAKLDGYIFGGASAAPAASSASK